MLIQNKDSNVIQQQRVRDRNLFKESIQKSINYTTEKGYEYISVEELVPAPDEWQKEYFPPITDDKKLELFMSIKKLGQLNPIIVWERPDGKKMILAGHNRVEVFKKIYEDEDNEKYQYIKAEVKKDISQEEAKEIFIDENFVQRGDLPTMSKAKCILFKYNSMGRKKRNTGGKKTAEVIAEQFDLKPRQIYNYYKLSQLIEPFCKRIDEGTLSLTSGYKLAALKEELQQMIYNQYNDQLDNKKASMIKSKMTKEEIIKILESKKATKKNISYKIPENLEHEFRKYVEVWLKKKGIALTEKIKNVYQGEKSE